MFHTLPQKIVLAILLSNPIRTEHFIYNEWDYKLISQNVSHLYRLHDYYSIQSKVAISKDEYDYYKNKMLLINREINELYEIMIKIETQEWQRQKIIMGCNPKAHE